jgi:dihydrolipoamide dehydrogenase
MFQKQMQKIMTKQGMAFELGQKVTAAKASKSGVALEIEPAKGGDVKKLEADIVLVAIGRKAYTDRLNLDAVGVSTDERGRVDVNEKWQTNVGNIFAIGDVIKGPMLAHKAEEEGAAVAEILAGQHGHVNFDAIPGIVYTSPEVAQVGKTESELKASGTAYKIGKFPFSANGRARAMNQIDGFAKILACSKTDRVLGAQILGPDAGHLIAEIVLGIEFSAAAEDIARTSHAHPTLSEVVKEAALDVDKRALHI